jgi:hypothetical protein
VENSLSVNVSLVPTGKIKNVIALREGRLGIE